MLIVTSLTSYLIILFIISFTSFGTVDTFSNTPTENALAPNPAEPIQDIDKFKSYRGNQPSSTILLNELIPKSFGALIVLYEHEIFVMASLWDINPFDQWGVEMGKKVADEVFKHISLSKHTTRDKEDTVLSQQADLLDGSTKALLTRINQSIDED